MKRVVRVFRDKASAEAADVDYWLRRPVHERIAAVETLRAFVHGPSPRMKRVLVVMERKRREFHARP
ncbi:MAG: hypothetical protein U0228_24960 [Myxococcaceae bacterium]